jgi:hypothetical protein
MILPSDFFTKNMCDRGMQLPMDNIKSMGREIHIFMCIVATIIASIIFNILIKSGYTLESLIIGRENYEILKNADFLELTLVTFFTRIKQVLIVYVLYRLINPDIVYSSMVIVSSFVAGGMICVQTFYEGFLGVLELILFFFPHYIFYFLLVRIIYIQMKKNRKIVAGRVMLVLILFLSGMLCELIFSKIFLNEFYQYMVLT